MACVLLVLANVGLACMGVAFALASKSVIDGATAEGSEVLVWRSTVFFGIIVLQALLQAYCRHAQAAIQGKLEMGFKSRFLSAVLKKDYRAVMAYHSGDLLNRLTSDVQAIANGVTSLLPTFSGLITKIVSAFWVLCVLDWRFSLIFALAGAVMFVVTRFFRKRLKALHKRVQETDGQVRSFLQELLSSFLVIRTFQVEGAMEAKGRQLQQDNYSEKIRKNTISVAANTGIGFIFNLGYLYALMWSCQGLIAGTISFGTLTAVLQLVNQVQSPFVGLSGMLPQYYGALASAERMMDIEALPDEPAVDSQPYDADALYAHMVGLELRQVCFRYDRDRVLDQADLYLERGSFAVISGLSGIGKSTLLKLLLGVFTPDSGHIGLRMDDGFRIAVDRQTRGLFAYVPQGNFLLSGTIRENIAFIRPEATEQEIIQAAEHSCAMDFIRELPMGMDTVIGEKGLGLSEGQIQRLAIARALLGGAPVLLLDEVTSALDGETEKRVLKNIQGLKNRTCLIVTHKAAALTVCDVVLRITDGKIIMEKRVREVK
nr:ABC transporter ATP-binding protein [Eubacterium sp. 1001713B170207_170306_E7]